MKSRKDFILNQNRKKCKADENFKYKVKTNIAE